MKNKKKLIGIDSFSLNHGMSGAGSYLSELVANMETGDFEACIFGHELDRYTYCASSRNVQFKGINIRDSRISENFWHKTHLNAFIKKNRFDAMLYVSGFEPSPFNLIVPSFFVVNNVPTKSNFIGNIYIKHIINQLAGVIVPSKYVKNALIDIGIASSKITVIANGVNKNIFKPIEQDESTSVYIQPFSIKRPFIIYVASLSSLQKGHIELIRAFDIFKQKTNLPHKLVLAGGEGEATEEIRAEVLRSHNSSSILLTGYFPHESLNKLYSAAEMCIFPSKNEGSTLSVLEALAARVPTACANAGALKEIDRRSVLHFEPGSPEDIALAMERLIKTDETREFRNTLVENGAEYANNYNWKNTAQKTMEYILSILR